LVPTRFGFNESKHPWMDEGFTTYVSDLAENEFATKKVANPEGNYRAYYSLVNSGKEQHKLPMETVMMKTDIQYSYVEYLLSQLNYVIGKDKLQKLSKYFHDLSSNTLRHE
jgi:hypothetical protein